MRIDRRDPRKIDRAALNRISNEYHRSLTANERKAMNLFESIMNDSDISKRQKGVLLKRGIADLMAAQMIEADRYFLSSMSAQYDMDEDFIAAWIGRKQAPATKTDNRRYTERQRRAAKDKHSEHYVHYMYAPDTKDADGETVRGRLIGRYEGKTRRGIAKDVQDQVYVEMNRHKSTEKKKQAFRDAVNLSSDQAMNANTAFWRASMDEYQGKDAKGAPLMQHVANASACVFCKMFDINNYNVSSTSERPHRGCRCLRIPLAHVDLLIDEEPWREVFEDMEHAVHMEARDDGEVLSFKDAINNIRTLERKRNSA